MAINYFYANIIYDTYRYIYIKNANNIVNYKNNN